MKRSAQPLPSGGADEGRRALDAEEAQLLPRSPVLEGALRPASIAAAPTAAMLVDLCRDEMALHRSQERLAFLQTEAQRRCGIPGRWAPTDADFPWVRETHRYNTKKQLITNPDERVIRPAEAKVLELRGPLPE